MNYSYVMGIGKEIISLKKQGLKIRKSKSDYKVVFAEDKTEIWEDFVCNNLQEGYWNEYITNDKVIFIFKYNEKISRYEVNDFNDNQVLELCEKLCGHEFGSIYNMLIQNKFYKKIIDNKLKRERKYGN